MTEPCLPTYTLFLENNCVVLKSKDGDRQFSGFITAILLANKQFTLRSKGDEPDIVIEGVELSESVPLKCPDFFILCDEYAINILDRTTMKAAWRIRTSNEEKRKLYMAMLGEMIAEGLEIKNMLAPATGHDMILVFIDEARSKIGSIIKAAPDSMDRIGNGILNAIQSCKHNYPLTHSQPVKFA